MKRFGKIFLPLLAIVVGIQMLGAVVFRWCEETEAEGFVVLLFCILCLFVPASFLADKVGKKNPDSATPLVFSSLFCLAFMFERPGIVWYILLLIDPFLMAAATFWAFREKEKIQFAKEKEESVLKEQARGYLNRFKASINRQYFVISNVESKDVLYEMDDDCLLFQLPDGRHFVLLKQPRSALMYQHLLNAFRNEVKEDLDVIGYIDSGGKNATRMVLADSLGNRRKYTKGTESYIPFDFSLLDGAYPIVSSQPKE